MKLEKEEKIKFKVREWNEITNMRTKQYEIIKITNTQLRNEAKPKVTSLKFLYLTPKAKNKHQTTSNWKTPA